jgi:hypothetical protein
LFDRTFFTILRLIDDGNERCRCCRFDNLFVFFLLLLLLLLLLLCCLFECIKTKRRPRKKESVRGARLADERVKISTIRDVKYDRRRIKKRRGRSRSRRGAVVKNDSATDLLLPERCAYPSSEEKVAAMDFETNARRCWRDHRRSIRSMSGGSRDGRGPAASLMSPDSSWRWRNTASSWLF